MSKKHHTEEVLHDDDGVVLDVLIRTAYDHRQKSMSDATALDCSEAVEPSLTQQSFRDESDINTIMRRYEKTGIVPGNAISPRYGDVSMAVDYQSALNIVMDAEEAFLSLSANVRNRFHNDPAQFLAFMGDEKNKDEAIRLGLINSPPEAPEGDVPPPVVNPPSTS